MTQSQDKSTFELSDALSIRNGAQMSRVIVDENVGPGTSLWEQYQCTLGDRPVEYVFLKDVHPGIPDVEILDKLLKSGSILLTNDRALHMQAVSRGFRSYTLNEQGQLTRHRLPGIQVSDLPQSVHRTLQPSYLYQPTNDLPRILKKWFSDKQLARYRRARRRIRSHFGSAAAIGQVSVTIGSKLTSRGLLCGFVFNIAGNNGATGLHATEGYCLTSHGLTDAACPVIHGLRDLFLLQLDQVTTELFVLPGDTLKLCHDLQFDPKTASPLHETLRRMIQAMRRLTWQPCLKGRFFDAMTRKLDQLARWHSNEVTMFDFDNLAERMLKECEKPIE